MTQIVEPCAGQGSLAKQPHPFMCQRPRLKQAAISLANDKSVVGQPDADQKQFLGLLDAMKTQFLHDCSGQGHCTWLSRLGLLKTNACFRLFGGLDYSQLPFNQINRPPAEGADFTTPQAA